MSDVDLVIRGGTIADGLGGELFEADVAVADGKIVDIGKSLSRGAEEIDARGKLVAPGFVDIHTHYDAQVVWDQRLAPSSLNGVTTAVMGNCGVGFAPVREGDRERLIELMEGVEDLPGVVLREGLDWKWQSFGDYLQHIGRKSYDIDFAAQLPHAPLRVFVMGERACRLELATAEDMARMYELTVGAIKAGAIGFSTSRSLFHKSAKGDPTPSLRASEEELLAIGRGVADAGGGVLEIAPDWSKQDRDREFAMLRRIVQQTGVSMSFSISQSHSDPDSWEYVLGLIAEAQAEGLRMYGQFSPRPTGAIITIENSANPFQHSQTYRNVLADGVTPAALEQLRRADVRRAVIDETAPQLAATFLGKLGGFDRIYLQSGEMDYEPSREDSLGKIAAAQGRSPMEMMYDFMHEGAGENTVYFPVFNYAYFDMEHARTNLRSRYTLPGLGDGGAHVGFISDANYPTYLLTNWVNTRRPDGFELSALVRRQTFDTASYVGMTDRGAVRRGLKADLNVIDMDRLSVGKPRMARDLPAGGMRLMQRPRGFEATIVSGEVTYREGEHTGALPGRLVKGRAAAPTA
jgi:N-acyl-D-aspartate/D-glutamate deacylase